MKSLYIIPGLKNPYLPSWQVKQMNRNDFGFWGIDLSDEDFSKALAALGLFLKAHPHIFKPEKDFEFTAAQIAETVRSRMAENIIEWELPPDLFTGDEFIKNSNKVPAAAFAKAWTKAINSLERRFEKKLSVNSGQTESGIFWLIEQLSKPEIGIASVYADIKKEISEIVWDYPLRIGLLPEDEAADQFRQEAEPLNFSGQPLIGTHIEFIDIKPENSECNILLLPYGLKESVAKILQCPNSLRAGCVFVLGNMDESEESSISLINTLRTQSHSAGVYILPIFPVTYEDRQLNLRQFWFKQLIREISHNQTIDISLAEAYQTIRPNLPEAEKEAFRPVLFATRGLVTHTRLSRRMSQLGNRLSYPGLEKVVYKTTIRDKMDEMPPRSFDWMYSKSLKKMGESLLINKNAPWDSENATATSLSTAKKMSDLLLEDAPPPEKKPRWIQAEVWEQTKSRRRDAIKKGFLVANRTYSFEVYIGSPSKTSISGVDAFDETLLPPDKNSHELTVIFSEPQIISEPKVATIVLEREGNSTKCAFFIQIPEGISQINARIIISHRNRVLQTALLKARVAKTARKPAGDARIELVTESVIRPGMQDLSNRRLFDASLILNRNTDNQPHLTKIVNGKAVLISLAEIQDRADWFKEKITSIAKEPGKYTKLTDKKSVDIIRSFAQVGFVLFEKLKEGQPDTSILKAERIQLITTKSGQDLPIEFAYEREMPDDDAKLCPKAVESLQNGKCSADCPAGNESKFICPLAFWGLNRVIERHAYNADALKEVKTDFALQSEPIEGRTRLKVLTNSILATSDNVDKEVPDSSKKLFETLKNATDDNKVTYIKSWQELQDTVQKESPSLIVLLPHTLEHAATKLQILEISKAERLMRGRLKPEHLQSSRKTPSPVVFLMGCKTSNPEIAYEEFVTDFRTKGAALVIGSGSVILGRFASVVTSEFINNLKEPRDKEVPFGDLLLKVRQKKMAEGLFMVMALVAYGDTDWVV